MGGLDRSCRGLILQGHEGTNLMWYELLRRTPHGFVQDDEEALAMLPRLLEAFFSARDQPDGLFRIHVRYHRWLEKQDWYGPEHPEFFEPEE